MVLRTTNPARRSDALMFGKKDKKTNELEAKAEKNDEKKLRCPNCGSDDILPAGFGNLKQCQKCGTLI